MIKNHYVIIIFCYTCIENERMADLDSTIEQVHYNENNEKT